MTTQDASNHQIDIDETISRLGSKKGVESVTVLTKDGRIVRTTATAEQSEVQGKLLSKLARDAEDIVQELESQDELSFLRIRTKKHEIMVALDHNYLLVVVQSPQKDYQQSKRSYSSAPPPDENASQLAQQSDNAIDSVVNADMDQDVSKIAEIFARYTPDQLAVVRAAADKDSPFIFKVFHAFLDSLHEGTLIGAAGEYAIPWWAVIVAATMLLRLCIGLPLYFYQQRGLAKSRKLDKVAGSYSTLIASKIARESKGKKYTDEEFNKVLKKQIKSKQHALRLEHGCHPAYYVMVSIVQLSIWVPMTVALRRLATGVWRMDNWSQAFMPEAGMTTEGLFWFTNLSTIDSTYIMPACIGALYSLNSVLLYLWREKLVREINPDIPKAFVDRDIRDQAITVITFIPPVLGAYLALHVPTAISFYWLVSALFTTLQHLLLMNKRVRRLLTKS
ncbi:hypothetical protein GGI26_002286 [Coemansia sp. RSA 1358]|uniref:Roadblock/LAMTOR2 domain-containing protein n=1 Tax=Coemansia umbellata TaxID=1424467 RepID=A0ABQ8PD88_9FUNG|nr:hypothetical protein EDC05_006276 [Coemansia umbellata]KAJ2623447.1 hypothetical protein GGI26_002286 [Coemansia sp. RSA 1358]